MNMLRITCLSFALLLLSCLPASAAAQHETWQRVFTGDEFTVDINARSLTFAPHVFRAEFRTVFSKPEPISSNSPTKYKTRLEMIEFKTGRHYRYFKASLLDSTGKVVQSYPPD